MRITPLDIRNHGFPRRLSGYDRDEVDAFLRMVSEDYEAVVREVEQLRDLVARLETRVEELGSKESVLRDTLMTAQQLSEDVKRTAVKESEVLVSEAEIQGEKILDAAHRRAAKLTEDVREMKLVKGRLAAAVRTTIETHLALLEGLAEDPPNDPILEGKVAYLPRVPSDARSGGQG